MEARKRSRLLAPVLLLCASLAHAGQTYIVDAAGGPGVDFTDIPPAIAASQAGDVLLVQPGDYSPFDLDRGLTILGYGMPRVLGQARVLNIPAGEVGVVVGLDPLDLWIDACAGAVIVQAMGHLDTIEVQASDDVRLLGLQVAPAGMDLTGARIWSSRVELVASRVTGSHGEPWPGVPYGAHDGYSGVHLDHAGRLHLVTSDAIGGNGGLVSDGQSSIAGSGGHGIFLHNGSELIVAGGGSSTIRGGYQGWCWDCTHCLYDAPAGTGIQVVQSSCRWSAATISSPSYYEGAGCGLYTQPPITGPATEAVPPDPVLSLLSTPQAGQVLQLRIWGTPGDAIRLNLGRVPVVVAEPPIVIERLTTTLRTLALGTMPASGTRQVSLAIPGTLGPGTHFFAQAELVAPGSREVRRTNSIPIIVR